MTGLDTVYRRNMSSVDGRLLRIASKVATTTLQ